MRCIAHRTVIGVMTLVIACGVTACSDGSDSAAPSTSGPRSTTTSRTSREPQPVTTTAPLVATEADLRACDRTIEPYFVFPPADQLGVPLPPPDVEGESLLVGAGIAFPPLDRSRFGDLDGDGTGDTLAQNEAGIFVVRGTVPEGPQLADVGVRLEDTSPGLPSVIPVGDRNGDGADDVAFGGRIVSGRALLAEAAGSVIAIPRPFATVPYLVAMLRVDGDPQPALVRIFGNVAQPPSRNDPIEVKIEGSESICLVTGNPDVDPRVNGAYDNAGGSVGVAAVRGAADGHRIVQFSYTNRNEPVTYRWDLDTG
jgi:hypothetical protein